MRTRGGSRGTQRSKGARWGQRWERIDTEPTGTG